MAKNKDKINFSTLIEDKTGYKVLPLTLEIRQDLEPLVQQAIQDYNAGPKFSGRVNEFGNYMENILLATSSKFDRPPKQNGKRQSTGYPDTRIECNGVCVYGDVKCFAQGSELSTQRSFYISTYDKITSDAVHVVIAFEHKNKILTGRYHIESMQNKTLILKEEYNTNNKELYTPKNAN